MLPLLVPFLSLPVQPPPADPWAPLRFLLGEWEGEGSGSPGEGSGSFSLRLELGGRALLRRNRADYPATKERPASHHEDLMAIFPEGGVLRALYLDNEGHVIHYEVTGGPGKAVFLSEAGPGPRFRLTYEGEGPDALRLRFEIAPPGKPEAFAPYLAARVRRRPSSKP